MDFFFTVTSEMIEVRLGRWYLIIHNTPSRSEPYGDTWLYNETGIVWTANSKVGCLI